MDRLRAGVALYNSGQYLPAHEPLEELWLEDPQGERDDCLQGLIQATAAVHKSRTGNDEGASGLAESAVMYLGACEEVPVAPLRKWLERLIECPDLATRESPPNLRLDGTKETIETLAVPAALIAADALAETHDDNVLATALEYAGTELAEDSTGPFVPLVTDYVRSGDPTVRQRLEEHVDRRRQRDSDVEGLFE